MRAMTGSRLAGVLSTAAVLLLPALGIGTANALDVGEVVPLLVPDQSQFPADPETKDFICVAVTDHAYWLVQDSTYLGSNPEEPDTSAVWGVLITQAEIDSLTAQFEGAGVDVYGTVTTVFGPVPDTDSDPRVWIVFADFPDYYQNQSGPSTRVNRAAYVNPADMDPDTSAVFNEHDMFYINAGLMRSSPANASKLRTWFIPSGLAMLIRTGIRPDEEVWIVRGLGQVAQFEAYGMTYIANTAGIQQCLRLFAAAPDLELANWSSGGKPADFGRNLAQELLWFMYLRQRVDDSICYDIAQSDTTGLINITRAIDPSVPDSLALDQLLFPLYEDYLIANVVNNLDSDYEGGIYRYDFLDGVSYEFTHGDKIAAFLNSFDSYPFGTFIAEADKGTNSSYLACRMERFSGDYSANPTVYFSGMYSDGGGSGSAIDTRWRAFVVQTDDSDIIDIVDLDLTAANRYSNTFPLAGGGNNYLIVTHNYPSGASGLRFTVSQDTAEKDVLVSMFQNIASPQYIDILTTLYYTEDVLPYGFNWYGPILDITHFTGETADSTAHINMTSLMGTIWTLRFAAWEPGSYEVAVTGYDSLGIAHDETRELAVGYVESSGLVLQAAEARIDVAPGSMAPGACVSLAETDMLGLSVRSDLSIASVEPALDGILAGPVSVSDFSGTISFPAEGTSGSVYRWTNSAWERVDSYFQSGRMCAPITEGGIYSYGTAPGVASPELPAHLVLEGTCPNPFSSEAVISFSLPSAGNASLRVYDMTGRIIRTIADGEMAAATHSLVWDGRDDSGNTVAAGVYFCRLEAVGQSAVQKMIRIAE